jgi:hypothetical protein
MKTLFKRIKDFISGQKPGSQDGPIAPSPNGLSAIWKGKMSPISQERLTEIEARLFVLSRTLGELNRGGVRFQARFNLDPHQAHAAYTQACINVNAERIQLAAERDAVEEYLKGN